MDEGRTCILDMWKFLESLCKKCVEKKGNYTRSERCFKENVVASVFAREYVSLRTRYLVQEQKEVEYDVT